MFYPSLTPLPKSKFQVGANQLLGTLCQDQKNFSIKKTCRVAWNLFSVIVFPVGIARVIGFTVKKIASSAVLPAQIKFDIDEAKNIPELKIIDKTREDFLKNPNNRAEQVTITTKDHVALDAITIKNPDAEKQKWVVFFNGNGMCYEQNLDGLKEISEKTGANVISFNYRGVMRSRGQANSSHDLVLDGEAIIQYLLSKKVPAKNILAHGLSLGGAVATEVAALHQYKRLEMHLCNERSFSTIPNFLKAMLPSPIAFVLGKIVVAAGWRFDSVKNYDKINGHKFLIFSRDDGVIQYPASLYKGLKEQHMTTEDRKSKKERSLLKKQEGYVKGEKTYNQDYKPKHRMTFQLELKDIKAFIEDSKECKNMPDEEKENLAQRILNSNHRSLLTHAIPIHSMPLVFDYYKNQVKAAFVEK